MQADIEAEFLPKVIDEDFAGPGGKKIYEDSFLISENNQIDLAKSI